MEGTAGFITRNVLAQNVPGGMQSTLYSGGYAVVSVGLGKENRRIPGEKYEILKSILPRGLADELLVDVRDPLENGGEVRIWCRGQKGGRNRA